MGGIMSIGGKVATSSGKVYTDKGKTFSATGSSSSSTPSLKIKATGTFKYTSSKPKAYGPQEASPYLPKPGVTYSTKISVGGAKLISEGGTIPANATPSDVISAVDSGASYNFKLSSSGGPSSRPSPLITPGIRTPSPLITPGIRTPSPTTITSTPSGLRQVPTAGLVPGITPGFPGFVPTPGVPKPGVTTMSGVDEDKGGISTSGAGLSPLGLIGDAPGTIRDVKSGKVLKPGDSIPGVSYVRGESAIQHDRTWNKLATDYASKGLGDPRGLSVSQLARGLNNSISSSRVRPKYTQSVFGDRWDTHKGATPKPKGYENFTRDQRIALKTTFNIEAQKAAIEGKPMPSSAQILNVLAPISYKEFKERGGVTKEYPSALTTSPKVNDLLTNYEQTIVQKADGTLSYAATAGVGPEGNQLYKVPVGQRPDGSFISKTTKGREVIGQRKDGSLIYADGKGETKAKRYLTFRKEGGKQRYGDIAAEYISGKAAGVGEFFERKASGIENKYGRFATRVGGEIAESTIESGASAIRLGTGRGITAGEAVDVGLTALSLTGVGFLGKAGKAGATAVKVVKKAGKIAKVGDELLDVSRIARITKAGKVGDKLLDVAKLSRISKAGKVGDKLIDVSRVAKAGDVLDTGSDVLKLYKRSRGGKVVAALETAGDKALNIARATGTKVATKLKPITTPIAKVVKPFYTFGLKPVGTYVVKPLVKVADAPRRFVAGTLKAVTGTGKIAGSKTGWGVATTFGIEVAAGGAEVFAGTESIYGINSKESERVSKETGVTFKEMSVWGNKADKDAYVPTKAEEENLKSKAGEFAREAAYYIGLGGNKEAYEKGVRKELTERGITGANQDILVKESLNDRTAFRWLAAKTVLSAERAGNVIGAKAIKVSLAKKGLSITEQRSLMVASKGAGIRESIEKLGERAFFGFKTRSAGGVAEGTLAGYGIGETKPTYAMTVGDKGILIAKGAGFGLLGAGLFGAAEEIAIGSRLLGARKAGSPFTDLEYIGTPDKKVLSLKEYANYEKMYGATPAVGVYKGGSQGATFTVSKTPYKVFTPTPLAKATPLTEVKYRAAGLGVGTSTAVGYGMDLPEFPGDIYTGVVDTPFKYSFRKRTPRVKIKSGGLADGPIGFEGIGSFERTDIKDKTQIDTFQRDFAKQKTQSETVQKERIAQKEVALERQLEKEKIDEPIKEDIVDRPFERIDEPIKSQDRPFERIDEKIKTTIFTPDGLPGPIIGIPGEGPKKPGYASGKKIRYQADFQAIVLKQYSKDGRDKMFYTGAQRRLLRPSSKTSSKVASAKKKRKDKPMLDLNIGL